jgi:hypothetical protein
MALADYQQLVESMVRDQSDAITPADRDRAIELARLRYSQDAERTLTEDVTWLAAGFVGPLPTGWVAGAYVLDAEYPIGEQPPTMIELAVYQDPTQQQLAVTEALAVGKVVRVRFAAPHVLVGGGSPQDTIPAVHREAVASYAAHLLCKQLATYYAGSRESSIGADSSATDTRASNYRASAKTWRAGYFSGIGKADPEGAAAGGGGTVGVGQPAASVGAWPGRRRAGLVSIGVGNPV